MTPQQLVGLGLRLFALWLVITSLSYFTSIPTALQANSSERAVAMSYAIGAVMLLVALALWIFPMLCAALLLPRTRHTDTLRVRPYELARTGCALIGLWLFSRALPDLAWFVFRAFLITDGTSSYSALPIDSRLQVMVSLFEVIFALVLIAKASFFARLVEPAIARGSADEH